MGNKVILIAGSSHIGHELALKIAELEAKGRDVEIISSEEAKERGITINNPIEYKMSPHLLNGNISLNCSFIDDQKEIEKNRRNFNKNSYKKKRRK